MAQQVKPEERGLPEAVSAGEPVAVRPLSETNRQAAFDFLSSGTVDTIYMSGLIRDNGIKSPANRGAFYGAFGVAGELRGVALIGHSMLFETRCEQALSAFARLAQMNSSAHVILGAPEKIDEFWRYYGGGGQEPRRICRELLFVQREAPPEDGEAAPQVSGLRPATPDDLDLIAPVQALLVYDECGVNPLARDAEGFRRRIARRVAMGRVWVLIEGGRLVFKVDVLADTPEAAYLESLYVHPAERGKGYGRRCLARVSRTLLRRAPVVCLVADEQNKAAQSFFFKAGFKLQGLYDTIYLVSKSPADA